jgi:predicted Zn-dependent protease
VRYVEFRRFFSGTSRVGLAFALTAGLSIASACDTSEERAEEHYQAGLELLDEGDVNRALVEFRNVFQLNDKHQGARIAYARAQLERGNISEAYGHYLRLVENYPDNLEGQRALAELAVQSRNWPEAERYVTKAKELAPDDARVQSVDAAVSYFNALQDKDAEAQEAAVFKAQALVQQDESLRSARNIVIDDLVRKQDWYAALDAIDEALVLEPDDQDLYRMRIGILQKVGDLDGIGGQLRDLIERFPEERNVYKQALVRFLIARGQVDEAESFIRQDAEREGAEIEDRLLLISFLEQARGREAALEEVENMLASGLSDEPLIRSAQAKLNFQLGNVEEGIAQMEELVKDAERTDQTRRFEVDLARMMFLQNNAVGARALIETVLSEDPSQPDAIKLKANWLIDDDETGDAIVMLRDALNQSPEDAELMSLMARAYEREGNHDLSVEMLALAVQASGNAATESLRYANSLANDGKFVAAEGVLIDALRLAPQNISLLRALGNVYVAMEDWTRTDDVIAALEKQESSDAKRQAAELTAQKLSRQDRGEELTSMLENLKNDPEMGKNAEFALLRNRLQTEGPEAARDYLDELLAESPDEPALRFLNAGFLAGSGKPEEAESEFRALLSENPEYANVWIALYRLKLQTGDREGANEVLKEALDALPENGTLLWAQAGEHERAGDYDAAIQIYEDMYARNSNSLIVANNLASLLANNRTDDESLQRAYTVSRRLSDTDVPAFQDTYGWITFRRGSQEVALEYLRAAAEGLPNDVTVQYHLAVNLAALGMDQDALKQFQKVQTMIDPVNPPPFAAEVSDEIKRLGGN